MRVLLVGLDERSRACVERAAEPRAVETVAVEERDALEAARAGGPPAAVLISERVAAPVRLAQAIAGVDRDTAITILCAPEHEAQLRHTLRFTPSITPDTACRSTADLDRVAVELAAAAQAAERRRAHRADIDAATARLSGAAAPPRHHSEALGRLVEAAPIGVMTLDAAQRVAAWNAHAAAMLGEPEAVVLGAPVQELFDRADRERLREMLEEPGRPRPATAPALFRRLRAGEEQHVEISCGPTVSQAGERGRVLLLADVTRRVMTERARRRAEETQAFLAETAALLDAPLDPAEMLRRVAALAVPARAELCVIDRVGEDGTIAGVAFAATDPEAARTLERVRHRRPLDPGGKHPVARVLRTGRGVLLHGMSDATFAAIAQGDEHLALMRRLRYRSAIVAPLIARGRSLGAISLLRLDPAARYTADDLHVLEDVARRAALALDNARLYAREHQIAETLQRSLLPARLPDVPGMSLAARYEPAEGEIGGDWYDVVPLPDGRIGCVVGDIVGRGIEAAAAMGQLRNAVRVYALERESPGEVVNAVDRLAESLGIGKMTTLLYLVVDPARGTAELCNAGHPPPLLLTPGSAPRYLESGRSAPIAVGLAGQHVDAVEAFPPGSSLVLYTDGLIERRGESLDEGMGRLERAVAAAPAEPARLVEDVVARLHAETQPDDVAVLAVRNEPAAHRLRLSAPADPRRVAELRRGLRDWLEGRVAAEDRYDVLLACSEACANAVEHAYGLRRGEVELEAELLDDAVRLVVRDSGRWRPSRASDRGRGTAMMKAAMDDVRITTGDGGTEVVMHRRLRSPLPA